MKKKIGILTFHKAHNYGAVLQVWALSQFLKNQGYFVEVVNYLSRVNKRSRLILFFKRRNILKLLWGIIFIFRRKYKKYKVFEIFINEHLPLSSKVVRNKEDIKNLDYEIYIIGSDQVWNTGLTEGIDDIYWGEFETKTKANKISYAASCEGYPYSKNEINLIMGRLGNFSAISCRENDFSNYLQTYTPQMVSTVLDPTLLISNQSFEDLAVIPQETTKFVLIYQVMENIQVLSLANRIANQLGAEVIELRSEIKGSVKTKNVIEGASPEEFLGYFKTAQCIVTTSFHGTAFSLIYEKPFYFVDLKNNAKRSTALLSDLGLDDRIVSVSDNVEFSKIDYKHALFCLNKKKTFSSGYLKSALRIEPSGQYFGES